MNETEYQKALDMDSLMSHQEFTKVLFPEIITVSAPKGNEVTLDVGTGTGHLADVLVTKIPEGVVIGVDESDAMLRVAREKAVKRGLHNYYPFKARAEDIPFRDGYFDLAYCVRAMHHFDDPLRALKEVHRLLKANGNFLLCEPLGPRDEGLRQVLTEAFQAAHPDHKFFSGDQIDSLIKEAGFNEVRGTEIGLAFHQEGLGGVPMGPHYMEAYHLIKMRGDSRLLEKFNEQVLQVTEGPGGSIFLHGTLYFLVSYLEKVKAAKKAPASRKKAS